MELHVSTYSDFSNLKKFALYDSGTFLPNLDLKNLVDTRYTLKLLILSKNTPKVRELAETVIDKVICEGKKYGFSLSSEAYIYGVGKIIGFDGKRDKTIKKEQDLTEAEKILVETTAKAFAKAIYKVFCNDATKAIFDEHQILGNDFKNEILAVQQKIYNEDTTQTKSQVLAKFLKEAKSATEYLLEDEVKRLTEVERVTYDHIQYKFADMLDKLKLAKKN